MKGMTRVWLVLSVAIGFVLGATRPSLAHLIDESQFTYWTADSNCTHGRIIQDHTHVDGRVESHAGINGGGYGEYCAGTLLRSPDNIKVRVNILKKTSTGSYGWCWGTVYVYNSATAYGAQAVNYGVPNQCGSGTYRVEGEGYVNVNGSWYGGVVRSYHDY